MRGHIVKRGKDSWTIVIPLAQDPATGKRRQQWVSVNGTKKDAEKRLSEMLHQLDTGAFVRPNKQTLGDFLRQWLRDYAATNIRPKTLERYRSIVECHLIPDLGNIPLTQLTAQHIQSAYGKWLAGGRLDGKTGGLSARTVAQHHRILKEALSHALRWGLVGRNVADAVDPPRWANREMQTLDSEGVRGFLDAVKGTMWHPVFHLSVFTGLRRSELLGLRWRDVDLDMASLSVVQTMHHLNDGKIIFQAPKTAKGKRLVALSPAAVLALRSYRERREAERAMLGVPLAPDALVFSHPDGSPILPDSVSHAFTRIAKRLGFQGVRLHDLRHTHASLMLRQGVHPKIVSERLGHATVSITLDTYSHVTPGLQEAAALRFDEGLARPEPAPALVGSR